MQGDDTTTSPQPVVLAPTPVDDLRHFSKVVDCQWACPTHTPVPEYIRLIAQGRYAAAYMLNWESNVFPGILGRVCDRPCEPACRRGRVQTSADANAKDPTQRNAAPVAICRLKRVAADYKGDIDAFGRALQLDPAFTLTPAEAGHPLWGPVFRSLKPRGPS